MKYNYMLLYIYIYTSIDIMVIRTVRFYLVGHHWTLKTLLLCVNVTTGFSKCLESHKTILFSQYETIWLLLYAAILIPYTARVWVTFVDLDASENISL